MGGVARGPLGRRHPRPCATTAHAGRFPPGGRKERVSVLLATVDTQQHYFRYVIRAYGYGETEESWLMASGSADNLAALEEILFGSVYADPDGREYAVKAAMIDAMGGRTAEVYRWAVRHRGRVFPWQGVCPMAQVLHPSHCSRFPDASARCRRSGVDAHRHADAFKSIWRSLSASGIPAGQSPPLHANNGRRHWSAWRTARGQHEVLGWENPANKPNHFWDREAMQRAFAFILNVRHRRRPDEETEKVRPVPRVR